MGRTFADALRAKYSGSGEDGGAELLVTEGQKEEKKWELVGMDGAVRTRAPSISKLRSVGLDGEVVEVAGEPAEIAELGASVMELGLTQCGLKDWEVASGVAVALPKLVTLDLSANAGLGAAELPAGQPFRGLQTLVLNKTGVKWKQVAVMSHGGGLSALQVLRLDLNEITEMDGPPPELPSLRSLSLTGNGVSSWRGLIDIARALPSLTELLVSGNKLPSPGEGEAVELRELPLESLAVADNPTTEAGWFKELGKSERLRALRVTAATCYEGVAPQHARLLVIAEMPHLVSLNSSDIRPRERKEAERFYLSRACSELRKSGFTATHKDDCSDLPQPFIEKYPFYPRYAAMHGNPSEQAQASQATGGAGAGTAKVTLRGACGATVGKPDVVRALPLSVKVGQLKAVIRASFGVAPQDQKLIYKNMADDVPCPIPLDSDVENLAFYGVGDEGLIEVHAA
eukprot:Hpha_TRINITY_DN18645_c0_g1::TRINITY_DN18645_c0_g1_i1::g.115659::m.115659